MGSIPFVYLGVPSRVNSRSPRTWKSMAWTGHMNCSNFSLKCLSDLSCTLVEFSAAGLLMESCCRFITGRTVCCGRLLIMERSASKRNLQNGLFLFSHALVCYLSFWGIVDSLTDFVNGCLHR
ncbi:Uncharacterized protein TCM_001681 [Theobroma cacao]|uniref:Uncharacterized protein n=1 Tax=Theobroma cacao TaxID=3641 RepID=A0A061DL57_THECC|nr:Uncharacterized protein TCM_001681 [Theobroma cacao]